jgi:hypothetical protein
VPPPNTDKPEERRAAERRACHCPCLVYFDRKYLDGLPGSIGTEGEIRDISECGVGLVLRPPVPPGATLTIDSLGRDTGPLPPIHVVRCVPAGLGWHHGCALDRRLSAEELRDWLG